MEFRIPSRGLIGLRSEMLTETRGTIVMNAILDGYIDYQGEIRSASRRTHLRSSGNYNHYALDGFKTRHAVVPMVPRFTRAWSSASTPRQRHRLNCVREKRCPTCAASGSDEAIRLVPNRNLTLEQSIEFIADDELVEVTPKSLRLRKRILQANRRPARASQWSRLTRTLLVAEDPTYTITS